MLFLWTLFRGLVTGVGRIRQQRSLVDILVKIVERVVVGRDDVEWVAVDFHIAANRHIRWSNEIHVLVNILVLPSVQELALDDARVLLGRLVDWDAVISQVEGNDEAAVDIFWDSGVEAGGEPQNLLVVVDTLEEVALWLFWDELVDVA